MLRRLSNFRRLWRAARILARNDALFPKEYEELMPGWARFARRLLGGGRAKNDTAPPGVRLSRALESLGPAYIKLGQVLATRADIVGDDVAIALAQLQDRLPPFAMAQSRAVIENSLGRPVDTVFGTLSEPIAAASIAQVHEGMTTDDPPVRVAVKVLRPGIAVEFGKDLSAFALAARLTERFIPQAKRLRPVAMVDTLAISVAIELDLRMEAAGASELADRTRNAGLPTRSCIAARKRSRYVGTVSARLKPHPHEASRPASPPSCAPPGGTRPSGSAAAPRPATRSGELERSAAAAPSARACACRGTSFRPQLSRCQLVELGPVRSPLAVDALLEVGEVPLQPADVLRLRDVRLAEP